MATTRLLTRDAPAPVAAAASTSSTFHLICVDFYSGGGPWRTLSEPPRRYPVPPVKHDNHAEQLTEHGPKKQTHLLLTKKELADRWRAKKFAEGVCIGSGGVNAPSPDPVVTSLRGRRESAEYESQAVRVPSRAQLPSHGALPGHGHRHGHSKGSQETTATAPELVLL